MGFPKYCAYDARITKFSRAIVRENIRVFLRCQWEELGEFLGEFLEVGGIHSGG